MTGKSKTILLPKNKCMNKILEILKEKEKATIIREAESSIKFQKGSFWSIETSPEKARIISTINFQGNGETSIEAFLNIKDSIMLDILVNITVLIIFILIVSIVFPLISNYTYLQYLNGEILYDTYLFSFYYWKYATLFFITVFPIIVLLLMVRGYFNKKKGLDLVMENIFSTLSSIKKQEQIYEALPKQQSEKIVIKERVKVTYGPPSNCPKCGAILNYDTIRFRGVNRAECLYCNSLMDLIEKEI